ncbi:unnamed protein product [Rotaria magnacalcarata]|uniref:Coenzyme Q-binding protein COQ10 START domain-containing protein n=3 Tax=Rotaria magnacalcarata TaxID=392030 RepID=A0A819QSD3_9BILA|nr:unnamed protein product [Rotaria magnacalcarata]CAF4033250.1 unnamed protein product [Rotaria magnacalcarata]
MGWNIILRPRPMSMTWIQYRTLFGINPPTPSFPFGSKNKTQHYAEQRLLGYTSDEMYAVVVDVARYREFVPWCIRSEILKPVQPKLFKARMEIGFQVLKEQYTAVVTHEKPGLVKSVCTDGALFNYLITEWRFLPGAEKQPRSCVLDFYVSFEFRSLLHAKVATMFFDEVVRQMVSAFLKRAEKLYGPASIPSKRIR